MNIPRIKQMLCTDCKKIVTLNIQYKYFAGVVIDGFLISGIIALFINNSYDMTAMVYRFIIILAIYGLAKFLHYYYYKNHEKCSECDRINTLIEINTPEAVEIIKANNLSIPDLEEDKFPWQKS